MPGRIGRPRSGEGRRGRAPEARGGLRRGSRRRGSAAARFRTTPLRLPEKGAGMPRRARSRTDPAARSRSLLPPGSSDRAAGTARPISRRSLRLPGPEHAPPRPAAAAASRRRTRPPGRSNLRPSREIASGKREKESSALSKRKRSASMLPAPFPATAPSPSSVSASRSSTASSMREARTFSTKERNASAALKPGSRRICRHAARPRGRGAVPSRGATTTSSPARSFDRRTGIGIPIAAKNRRRERASASLRLSVVHEPGEPPSTLIPSHARARRACCLSSFDDAEKTALAPNSRRQPRRSRTNSTTVRRPSTSDHLACDSPSKSRTS